MKYDKKPKTIDESIELLRERKLIIDNTERAKLTNTYSLKYGFLWFAKKDLFQDVNTYEEIYNEIRKEFENPKERFLKSFKNRYTDELPPSNMALETLSLGKLSRLYKGLKNDELKIGIASEFNLISSILSSFLVYLSHVRNICAHHSRLWNKKITVDRSIMPNRKEYNLKAQISKTLTQQFTVLFLF